MSQTRSLSYRRSAWLAGLVVLVSLATAVALMFRNTMRDRARLQAAAHVGVAGGVDAPTMPLPLQSFTANERDGEGSGQVVKGIVRRPDGLPAASATVSFQRIVTAWPEWRTEPIVEAITSEDGTFQFRSEALYGHVIGFEHPNFAGGMQEVPLYGLSSAGAMMELRLQPRSTLFGYVQNDTGAAVPNARVAIESVPGGNRRAQFTYTSASGRYEFDHVAAGPVRLVAHLKSWQPAIAPAVVIGDRRRVDLRFDRPTMTPLRGAVISAASQLAIAGATVELVPINQKLGLVAPIGIETAVDGSFLLEGLPRGSMRLLVRHPEHGTVIRTQTIGPLANELTIEMPPRSVVDGQLVTERYDDVFIGGEVLKIQDVGGQVAFTRIDADGRFRFDTPLSPGWAELNVINASFGFARSYVPAISIRIDEDPATNVELVVVPPSRMRGRFVDSDGQPVAGVRVRQTRVLVESARDISNAVWQLDLPALGSRVAALFGQQQDPLLAVSAADGTFEMRGMKFGPLQVRSELPGYGSRWLRLLAPMPDSPSDLGDLPLARGGTITGRVLRGNRGFAGATVVATGDNNQALTVTNLNGRFFLPDLVGGRYSVRAKIPGQSTGSSDQIVDVPPGGTAESVLIVLEVGRTVRGRVTTLGGQALPDALVSVRGAAGQVHTTDGDGRFVLELPARAMELLVSLGDRSRQQIVTVAADQQSVDVQLDTPPTCTLKAQVAGLPGPRRLLSALLRLTQLDDEQAETRTRWIELIAGELESPCPSGRVRIEVWCDGYAPFVEERDLAANETHNLGAITLEPGSRLRGIVHDEEGSVIVGAVVLLGEETDLDLFEPNVRSGVDGGFQIRGVTSRSSRLVVRAPGWAASTVDLQLPADVLSPEPLVIALERGATIEVLVPSGSVPDGSLVRLRRQGRLLATAELDDRGRAWFANRSAGTYSVELFGRAATSQAVVIEYGAKLARVRLVPAEK